MEPIEQVILHVKTTDSFRSAEIATCTELVLRSDMAEIVDWFSGPASETLIRFDPPPVLFHPLPSGAFALGRIGVPKRRTFSFTGAPNSFFVHLFVIPPVTLLRKGNNPLALYRELERQNRIPPRGTLPKRLHPLVPTPLVSLCDTALLRRLASNPGPVAMAALNQSLFDTVCTFFTTARPVTSPELLDGILNLLPLHFRTELTFSTGLLFSPRILLRLIAVGAGRRRAALEAQMLGVPLTITEEYRECELPPESLPLDPWPRFVHYLLRYGDPSLLRRELELEYEAALSGPGNESPAVDWSNLHELGAYRIRNMRESQPPHQEQIFPATPSSEEFLRCSATVEELLPLLDREHRRRPPEMERFDTTELDEASSATRIARHPDLKDLILKLDSSVARIVFGDGSALEHALESWKEICANLDWHNRDRLREEYLALIRSFQLRSTETGPRQARHGAQLLELILLFLEGAGKK